MSGNIHAAVRCYNCRLLKKLLMQGADVNAKDDQCNAPLHTALYKKSKTLVEILLAHGADVNVKNRNSETPLDIAIRLNSAKIVEILLRYGADVSVKNWRSETTFEIAIRRSSSEIVELLLKYRAVQILQLFTLNEALKTGNIAFIKLFLESGCKVEGAPESGIIPLHYAIQHRLETVAHLLLDHGADANSKDTEGLFVLHKAVIHDASTKLVDRLLENGAILNAKDNYDMTPLNYAIDRKNGELIRFILDKNPDIHDKENKSAFCLLFIKDYEFASVTELFIKRGFTLYVNDFNDVFVPKKLLPSVKDKFENKEFRCRVQDTLNKTATNLEEFVKLFLLYQALKFSIEKGLIDIVNNLLTPSVNVNIPVRTGSTMLHTAVINGHLPVVEKLLAFGADVNALDESNKMSTLHFSIEHKREEIATVLLKHNANTEVRNDRNQTPLDFAFNKFNYKIALLLLNAGANVDPDNLKGANKFLKPIVYNLDFIKGLLYFGALIDHRNFLNLFMRSERYTKNGFNRMKLFFNHNDVCSSDSSVEVKLEDFNRSSSKFQELIIKYVTFHGSSINSTEPKWYSFETKCQEEIAKMKLTKIEGFSISVDDVLRKTPRQIARDLKNEDFAQVLEQIDFKEKFPLYASKIRAHVRKGEVTKQLLEITSLYLEEVLDFPVLVKEKILSYLNDQELRRLIFLSPIDEAKKASLQFKEDEVDDFDDDAQDNDFDSDDSYYNDYSNCDDYYEDYDDYYF